jgi:hypothetical protein
MDTRLPRFVRLGALILLVSGLLTSACQTSNAPAAQTTAPNVAHVQFTTPTSAARGKELSRAPRAVPWRKG